MISKAWYLKFIVFSNKLFSLFDWLLVSKLSYSERKFLWDLFYLLLQLVSFDWSKNFHKWKIVKIIKIMWMIANVYRVQLDSPSSQMASTGAASRQLEFGSFGIPRVASAPWCMHEFRGFRRPPHSFFKSYFLKGMAKRFGGWFTVTAFHCFKKLFHISL